MKNLINRKLALIIIMTLISLGSYAQHDHDQHNGKKDKEQMEPMFKDKNLGISYSNYIKLKEALVASKFDESKKVANELQESLAAVGNAETSQNAAGEIATASNLDGQRKAFATLSNEMIALVKKSTLPMGSVYLDYCPMANGNTGAFWLSNKKEIKNPYFGDKMLKCGSIKETIN